MANAEEPKDLITFQLPESVRQVAPLAQTHFLQLLPYNTPRFQMKPRFVFLDRSETIKAPMSALVTRLNFIHLVYFREGLVAWNGSLLFGIKESPLLATREGYHLGVKTLEDGYQVTFQDGDQHFSQTLSSQIDGSFWLEAGDRRLLIYHYAFPENFMTPTP